MIAAPLLAHVAQCVFGAAFLELVQHDHVGEVEHVDLLELAGRAVFGRHHVQREVGEIDDLGVALPDAGGLDHDEVETHGAVQRDDVRQHGARGQVLSTGCQRTHEHLRRRQRVHPDAVAQQGAAGATTRGIDGDHGDAPIGELAQEALQQLVVQRALACAAGARHADDRRLSGARNCRTQRAPQVVGLGAVRRAAAFEQGDGARDRARIVERGNAGTGLLPGAADPCEHVIDHALEAEPATIFGCVDAHDAVSLERSDFRAAKWCRHHPPPP